MEGKKRWTIAYIILVMLVLTFLFLGISIGSVNIPLDKVWSAMFGGNSSDKISKIVLDIRLPRVLSAFILGGALAVSGLMLQVFFHNPIAGPFVLGVSSGAKLTVAFTMIFFLNRGVAISFRFMILSAFVGSMLTMGFVLLLSGKVKSMSMLVVCGVMVGYICSAITDIVVNFADDSNIVNLHNWSKGSFSGIGMQHIGVMAVVVFGALVISVFMMKPMNAYLLGEVYAKNLGVSIRMFRVILIVLSSLLAACVTAFAGPISFVGIAVPHLMRVLFKTNKPSVMIPACFLGGASFCLGCDLLARTLFAPSELSISSVTAVFGAPIVIYMMIRNRMKLSE